MAALDGMKKLGVDRHSYGLKACIENDATANLVTSPFHKGYSMFNATKSAAFRHIILTSVCAIGLAACSDSSNDNAKVETPAVEKVVDAVSSAAATDNGLPAPRDYSGVTTPAVAGTVDMDALLANNPLPDVFVGNADAPVTIVEYSSMTCPHCAAFHTGPYKELKKLYFDTGVARLISREFPFDPVAEAAFMLARCSGDNYFPMINTLFAQQSSWARAERPSQQLFNVAKLAGFTEETFNACFQDNDLLTNIRNVRTEGAETYGVDSTPTFFIDGKRYAGNMTAEQMGALIEAAR